MVDPVSITDLTKIASNYDFRDADVAEHPLDYYNLAGSGQYMEWEPNPPAGLPGSPSGCAKETYAVGDYNNMGFSNEKNTWTNNPDNMPKRGDRVWQRCRWYWPSGYNFGTTNSFGTKWMRMGMNAADGTNANRGYTTMTNNASKDGDENCPWFSLEGNHPKPPYFYPLVIPGMGELMPRMERQLWEWSFVLDAIPKDEGGMGEFWVWKDGVLMTHRTDLYTVGNLPEIDNTYVRRPMLIQNWNGGVQQAQTQYFCDYADAMQVAGARNDVPYMARDAQGNPCIGTAVRGGLPPDVPILLPKEDIDVKLETDGKFYTNPDTVIP